MRDIPVTRGAASEPSQIAEGARLKALTEASEEAERIGDFAQARAGYEEILRVDSRDLYVAYRLVALLHEGGIFGTAASVCDAALAIDPRQVALLHRRASLATALGDYSGALSIYRRIAEVAPDFELLDAKFGDTYAMLGRGAEAMEAYDRAVTKYPDNAGLQSDRLFVMNYFKLVDRKRLFDEHKRWGATQETRVATERQVFSNDRSANRRLRIGYVSPDLRNHAIAYFMRGVFESHDRSAFDIHCFDVSPYAEDAMTATMRKHADHWYRVASLTDAALSDFIREKAIDVLVDLSGHTAHNRLLTFARKPAPVQVSWFGYMNTTGLTAIDYRLTDAYMDPQGASEKFYTEKLYRIPSMACFAPHPDSPPVGPVPCASGRIFTFASVNQWTKISDDVKALWGSILAASPDCRLLVVARGGEFPGVRDEVTSQFVKYGANTSQVAVSPSLPIRDFLSLFSQVDVALDPFPYGGGTTSLHTLWMGVPIITLEGETEMSRAASGILKAVGLEDWVAEDLDGYRKLALGARRDPSKLVDLRADLRERMSKSSLMDAKGLTKSVEAAFREMWHAYSCG